MFDQIIGAYKVNGKQVERLRTSHNKRYNDLLKIAKLSDNTRICFIDDLYHFEMENKNLFYINVNPYVYEYTITNILNILKTKLKIEDYDLKIIYKEIINYKFEKNKLINEKEISKELYENIKSFFST